MHASESFYSVVGLDSWELSVLNKGGSPVSRVNYFVGPGVDVRVYFF